MIQISEHFADNFAPQPEFTPNFTGKASNPNKARGNYSRTAKNQSPSYTVPESYKNPPALVKDLIRLSYDRDVTISDIAMYARATGERQKQFYPDASKSFRALFSVLCAHVNLVTHQIEISLRNASDAAGLSTISDQEQAKADADPTYQPVVSISRTSRRIRDMAKMGLVTAKDSDQVWDKERGHWLDKYYEATPLFFEALGVTYARVEKHQQQRLGYLKRAAKESGMTEASVGRMSIAQIKAENKIAWRRNAFDRRKKDQQRKKVTRSLNGKSRQEQRNQAQHNVINALGDDLYNISVQQLGEMVNKEVATLRKFSGLTPPLH